MNLKRNGCHPLRGLNWHFGTWPGAHAPGFILASAPRTAKGDSSSMLMPFASVGYQPS